MGVIRKGNMYVLTDDGKIEYVAAAPAAVPHEIKKLFNDIAKLLSKKLSYAEAFIYASMLHLVFVKIHPYEDGNGRTARLPEKWFLEKSLGRRYGFQSEKYYYLHHADYYKNIRRLGMEYESLQFDHAADFLRMLPASLILSSDQH